MGSLINAIRGAFGRGAAGQSDIEPGAGGTAGLDESKALQFTQDRWNDLKNAYVVY